jgi:hypothetical protein
MVETYSWLIYYFYKVAFLTVVKLLLFIPQHDEMHKLKASVLVLHFLCCLDVFSVQ